MLLNTPDEPLSLGKHFAEGTNWCLTLQLVNETGCRWVLWLCYLIGLHLQIIIRVAILLCLAKGMMGDNHINLQICLQLLGSNSKFKHHQQESLIIQRCFSLWGKLQPRAVFHYRPLFSSIHLFLHPSMKINKSYLLSVVRGLGWVSRRDCVECGVQRFFSLFYTCSLSVRIIWA